MLLPTPGTFSAKNVLPRCAWAAFSTSFEPSAANTPAWVPTMMSVPLLLP